VNDGGCRPEGPAVLTSRSESEICARWSADYVSAGSEWEPTPDSSDACDPGTVPEAAMANTFVRLNLYRWLAGVPEVEEIVSLREQEQMCAVQMAAIGTLTHSPTSDMPCYSSAGASGAGSSNISQGSGLVGSIDAYVWDGGNENTFGHRRWVLGPYMSGSAFGHKSSFSCMYTFGVGGGVDPGYVAYPPPGYVPAEAAQGLFTFESVQYAPTASTRVLVAVNDGAPAEVESSLPVGGYGQYGPAIAFMAYNDVWTMWAAGTKLRITIEDTQGGDVSYTVVFTGCE
jgi:hypothetical protein